MSQLPFALRPFLLSVDLPFIQSVILWAFLSVLVGGSSTAWAASPSHLGFARYSPSGDFLHAGREKILLRWQGAFVGLKMKLTGRLSGGILARESPVAVGDLVRPQDSWSPALRESMDRLRTRTVAGWVCIREAAVLVVAPLPDPALPQLEALVIPGQELLNADEGSEVLIRGCAVGSRGELLVSYGMTVGAASGSGPAPRESLALLFAGPEGSSRIAAEHTLSESPVPVAVFAMRDGDRRRQWGVLMPSGPTSQGLSFLTLNGRLEATGTHEIQSPVPGNDPEALGTLQIAAEADVLLLAGHGNVFLSQFENDGQVLSSERLSIAPCSEQQACGVSVAADGSWAVVGYWGSYVGFGTQFRRLAVRSFSDENQSVVIAHTSVPGEIAIFGGDDASFERIPEQKFHDPLALSQPQNTYGKGAQGRRSFVFRPLTVSSKPRVAWLKSGELPRDGEEVLFSFDLLQKNAGVSLGAHPVKVTVVLTREGFDPQRHLAMEEAEVLEGERPLPPTFADARAPSGTWFQEFLRYVQAQERWTRWGGGGTVPPIVVTILDSGSDLAHTGFEPSPAGQSEDGVPFDLGYDFVDEDPEPQDRFGHGTHVSGLAKPNFPMFRHIGLVTARVLDAQGRSNSIDIGRGFVYAARRGSMFVNASWGGGAVTQFMQDSIVYAQSRGALVVTSAGNDGLNIDRNPPVPSNFDGVLSIGALRSSGARASFSNFGRSKVFGFVPGDTIESLALGGGVTIKSGTSMAAPLFVSSAAVLAGVVRALEPGWTPTEVQERVLEAFCPGYESAMAREGNATPFRDPVASRSRCGSLELDSALGRLLASPRLESGL